MVLFASRQQADLATTQSSGELPLVEPELGIWFGSRAYHYRVYRQDKLEDASGRRISRSQPGMQSGRTRRPLMTDRQRRNDEAIAKAVARGLNILTVRDAQLARRYMEYKHVPATVIARVLAEPASRRRESPEQAMSEAISPHKP